LKLAPGPRGIFAHAPNNPPYLNPDMQSKIQTYVVGDPTCWGAQLNVPWSSIEKTNGNYDWTFVVEYARPWLNAGKVVSLVFYGAPTNQRQLYNGNSPCPQHILSQIDSVYCPHTNVVTPVYWQDGYRRNYEKFIQASIRRFENEPWLAYMRFGIGSVGEDFPALKIPDGDEDCLTSWTNYGLTDAVWLDFTREIIDFIASQKPRKPIVLPINFYHRGDLTLPRLVAGLGAQYGFGFGSQGFGGTVAETGRFTPFGSLFRQFSGIVPLEIQTATNTGPESREGLLSPLIDTALDLNIQILELYVNEWIVANRNGPLASSYKSALSKASAAIGPFRPSCGAS